MNTGLDDPVKEDHPVTSASPLETYQMRIGAEWRGASDGRVRAGVEPGHRRGVR